jgi:prepilin-type N-terminal cleavage/methylation domain-containing protein
VAISDTVAVVRGRGCDESGLTLIELLVVLVVLGVLSAVVVFGLEGIASSSTEGACKADFATTQQAVDAYRIEMGGYPGGIGVAVATDTDPGTPPDFAAGALPQGVNAARSGGELLESANNTPNHGDSPAMGPWLRESPTVDGAFTIWVANDGSGAIQVLNASGLVPASPTQSPSDCTAVAAPSGSPTTSSTSTTSTSTTTTSTTTTTTSTTTTTTVPANQAPEITSDPSVTFQHGVHGSFSVTATGRPRPTLSLSGSLPSGLSFNRSTGMLSGTPRRSGTAHVTFVARNGVSPNATQAFLVTVR